MLKRMAYTCFSLFLLLASPVSSQAGDAVEEEAEPPAARVHLTELKDALKINACQEPQWQAYARAILSRSPEAAVHPASMKAESSAALLERHWREKAEETAWVGEVATAYRKLYDKLEPDQRLVADARFALGDRAPTASASGPARASSTATPEGRNVRVM